MHGTSRPEVPIGVAGSAFEAQREIEQDEDSHSSSSNSPTRVDYEESDFYLGNNDSQSSIGIPTLDAATVSEEDTCQPPINRLPAEVLINIFSKLSSPSDLLNCMLTSKAWARNAVDLLWMRPTCVTWPKHSAICRTLNLSNPYFAYRDFVKRLNLAQLADGVNDGSVIPLQVCNQVERLTLTGCKGITDTGLISLVSENSRLLALDVSDDHNITEASINVLAQKCKMLQGLNISRCTKISNEALSNVAANCRKIKRLKLNYCEQVSDVPIMDFAKNCPNILEIDLQECQKVGNEPITALMQFGRSLRELRLASCELITDSAFLSLPPTQIYEHLRILDLTSCVQLTDRAVERIIHVAPRLRNLVLAKCRNITDVAVNAISKLGKNLHYVHLGHCGQITDEAVKTLVKCCARIRYIDLGCCTRLTDASVCLLATLPKLRRIGLVKCNLITDDSVYALSQAFRRLPDPRYPARFDPAHVATGVYPARNDPTYVAAGVFHSSSPSSLERVHLSYCTKLTLKSIIVLLNNCPRLTHLSLTGVDAFLRQDLEVFCREAPEAFNQHQRQVFCVFSGAGVTSLRRYLNNEVRTRQVTTEMVDDDATLRGGAEDDDDATMTGMMGATMLGGDDGEADEDLSDGATLVANGGPTPPY